MCSLDSQGVTILDHCIPEIHKIYVHRKIYTIKINMQSNLSWATTMFSHLHKMHTGSSQSILFLGVGGWLRHTDTI
jgi:hypothetical protein